MERLLLYGKSQKYILESRDIFLTTAADTGKKWPIFTVFVPNWDDVNCLVLDTPPPPVKCKILKTIWLYLHHVLDL